MINKILAVVMSASPVPIKIILGNEAFRKPTCGPNNYVIFMTRFMVIDYDTLIFYMIMAPYQEIFLAFLIRILREIIRIIRYCSKGFWIKFAFSSITWDGFGGTF
jgi:hypothetical protein